MRRATRLARFALVSLSVAAVAAAGGKLTKEERAELHARIAADDAARAEKVALAASADPNTCVGRDHPLRTEPFLVLETAATYDGLPECANKYYKATISFGGITERECLAGLETDWGQYRGCRECFWRKDNRNYLSLMRQHTNTCCDECETQNDCADDSVECDAFLRCKAACLKKRDAVFDPARIRRHHNWAAEKSKYEGRDACAMFSRTCTSKPMQGMLWMSFLSVAAVQIWHFYGSRFGVRWWQNLAFLFTAVLAAFELARWFIDIPLTDVHMAGIALAYYTLLCVFGLIGIYLTTPPAAIDGDSDCKFGAALADALAYAEDPGRAEALSRILEDCIGSESEDGDE